MTNYHIIYNNVLDLFNETIFKIININKKYIYEDIINIFTYIKFYLSKFKIKKNQK